MLLLLASQLFWVAGCWRVEAVGKSDIPSDGGPQTDGGDDTDSMTADTGDSDIDTGPNLDVESGELLWAVRAGGNDYDVAQGVTAAADGSVAITGGFSSQATFGEGDPTEVYWDFAQATDVFVAQYDSLGTLEWAARVKGGSYDYGRALTALSDGSIIAAGSFGLDLTFDYEGPNETEIEDLGTCINDCDLFIARYGPDGQFQSVGQAVAIGDVSVHDAEALAEGSFILTGHFYENLTFDYGGATETEISWPDDDSFNNKNAFWVEHGPDGDVHWARVGGGPTVQIGYSIAVLPDGGFVAGGTYWESLLLETDAAEPIELLSVDLAGFVARFDESGYALWAARILSEDYGHWAHVNSVGVFDDGGVIASGSLKGTITFGVGEENEEVFVSNSADAFIARYDPEGQLVWARLASGSSYQYGEGVAALPDGSSLLLGYYYSTIDFGGGVSLPAASGADVFFAMYDPAGEPVWAKRISGGGTDIAWDMDLLTDDAFALAGNFEISVTFGAGEPNETTFTAGGVSDAFLAVYRY